MDKGVKKTKRAVQQKIWKERNGDKRTEWRTQKNGKGLFINNVHTERFL